MSLYIITVATHDDMYLPHLKESCKKNNGNLIVLGYGEKWKGFSWRFTLLLNFLNTIHDNDIVCFVDGFDVICTRNLKELPNVFYKLKQKNNCKIIIGEHLIADNHNFMTLYYNFILDTYFSKCKNKSINGGTYISNCIDLKYLINNIFKNIQLIDKNKLDDQILLTKYCNNNKNDIYIDNNNEIFLNLENRYQEIDHFLEITNDTIKYKHNYPFFVHGPGETYLDNVIIKLNYKYDYNNKIKNKLLNKYYEKQFFRIKNLDENFKILLSIFIVVIIFAIFYICYYFMKKNKNKIKK